MADLRVRVAGPQDWPAIWPIWHRVVASGDTYTWAPDTPEAQARALWMPPAPAVTLVAEVDEAVVGTALLKPVQPGLGDHVANAGFMVDPDRAGGGIGRGLAEATLVEARRRGYRAMQFNAVVEANTRAVGLWRSLGFEIVGTIPEAFRHPTKGLVGLHIMHRAL
ncbi:GNAT family N-acetyltransferase [Pseudonocardia sp. WMMC193]|uniref:GNAT family N-acetyltransferase n=1 Tax=Pseudonocardia sp. WMMC193 TaxID=2911965 RepID=UPI001F476215|nr:GNAT family N-acetyltransferase [Pseudonocardia sp. WMMC193]MCF7548149.1 GNAT family N-acetyltransferase [Pseudonocardia sp. WMMC193]